MCSDTTLEKKKVIPVNKITSVFLVPRLPKEPVVVPYHSLLGQSQLFVSLGKRNKAVTLLCRSPTPALLSKTGFLPTCTDILRCPLEEQVPTGVACEQLWLYPSHPSLTCLLLQLHVKLFVVNKKWIFQEDKQCLAVILGSWKSRSCTEVVSRFGSHE